MTEGVIKYRCDHDHRALDEIIGKHALADLNAWRTVLLRLGLIGQDAARYQGYGFGNMSLRIDARRFIITGTQTGHLPTLRWRDYALVVAADITQHHIRSQGLVKPSSEALTHASVYALDPAISCAIHVHSPDIWRASRDLALPCISPDIAYGSAEMAAAVRG